MFKQSRRFSFSFFSCSSARSTLLSFRLFLELRKGKRPWLEEIFHLSLADAMLLLRDKLKLFEFFTLDPAAVGVMSDLVLE